EVKHFYQETEYMAAILISVENINFWKICLAIGEESIYGVRRFKKRKLKCDDYITAPFGIR
ncbi:MAG: hypothetical protein LUQ11_09115, partial [Methylococcaceae bacterium]|nr:hypothetical protein [Methylococcaceae bacterium]